MARSNLSWQVYAFFPVVASALAKIGNEEGRDVPKSQEILNPAPGEYDYHNATFIEPVASWINGQTVEPASTEVNKNMFNHIFKRDCDLNCSTQDLCCTNPATAGHSYCCAATRQCGPGTSSQYCVCSVTTAADTTVTDTVTVTITNGVGESQAETTLTATVTSTAITVVTVSNLDTATDVTYVTAISGSRKARDLEDGVAFPKHTAAILSTDTLPSPSSKHIAEVAVSQITPAPRIDLRGRVGKRQNQNNVCVETQPGNTITITDTATATVSVTTPIYYTETTTTTSVYTSTFTSAVNAKTTVYVTSTITQPGAGMTTGGGGPTTSVSLGNQNVGDNNNNRGSSSGGLSTGAKAGIGAGAGAGALVLAIIAGCLLVRYRKNKKKEQQEMIDRAVAAATIAQNEKQYAGDAKSPSVGYLAKTSGYRGVASPPPPSEGYSDMIYHSTASPTLANTSPSLRPMTTSPPPTGHEMSATPAYGHGRHTSAHELGGENVYYPRPPDPVQPMHERMNSNGSPVEMYYPAPSEMPSVQSPRPQPEYQGQGYDPYQQGQQRYRR